MGNEMNKLQSDLIKQSNNKKNNGSSNNENNDKKNADNTNNTNDNTNDNTNNNTSGYKKGSYMKEFDKLKADILKSKKKMTSIKTEFECIKYCINNIRTRTIKVTNEKDTLRMYEEKLTQLMIKLDCINCFELGTLREERKSIIQSIQKTLTFIEEMTK